ncbi:uncharacterized protein CANTADRAFT_48839 [Suhomyces tanzawaensis NRRL Y-17324]|uniref:DUF1640-domain-containing protein n=1 Tax=Suhomyces tanzawaensis NRRL Y-17324 TaxID=984487 RepID=A0A1E4SJU9_9ASCO|nr:uncharacterized protein CANTADRAFT_48839 [Suhomyces tanzawaensis NRRL Y-17324]ODV79781.1 hypothetical protein CANTADRAFT_48839 [Suhomyces tanzawaensis NRRL Y-17324]
MHRSIHSSRVLNKVEDSAKEQTTKEIATDKVTGSSKAEEATPSSEDSDQSGSSTDVPHPDEFLTTAFDNLEPYMDTYSVYTQLKNSGFTSEQADSIIDLLLVQLNSKLSKLPTKYSQLFELENERYLFESAQQELRVDITRSREQHINELISLINILQRDFHIISDELNSDFIQMKNDSQVAINDQKSENTLLSKRIILKIQETNHKITTELNSAMRSEIESLRWNLSRWGLIAILISVFSGCSLFYAQKAKTAREEHHKNEFVPLVIYEPSEYDEDDYHTDLDKSLIS